MDPASLTTMAITMLNPYFVAAATSVATEAGKDIYEHSKKLFEFIKKRFAREPDSGRAVRVLEDSISDPDMRVTLETKLLRLIENDPAFASELQREVQSGPRQLLDQAEGAVAERVRMRNTEGTGSQEIKQGKYARATDIDFGIGKAGQP